MTPGHPIHARMVRNSANLQFQNSSKRTTKNAMYTVLHHRLAACTAALCGIGGARHNANDGKSIEPIPIFWNCAAHGDDAQWTGALPAHLDVYFIHEEVFDTTSREISIIKQIIKEI
jgi:hypothetical protein